jgi:glycosyltransferase involved in cell wall biosynthesis
MSKKKFRIHILGLPHTKTTLDFTACAYTMKAWKFCKMMKGRGHTIFHYGHEESCPEADENVSVLSAAEYDAVYGDHDYKSNFFKFDRNDDAYQTFYKNAIAEIEKRKQPGDIILPFWGNGVRPICDAHPDLITIEPGIGYAGGHWANFKIFESYAIYHAYCGLEAVGECKQSNYEIVIPNYFDLDEFEYSPFKDDYFLFVGRVYDGKGLNIAIQVTEAIGAKLKVAGQVADYYADEQYVWPSHVEFVGYADLEKRKKLMKHATASFLASQYVEPFGGVQIENLLSGTPTITTDWGAFTENNIEGVTGYRCRTFEDFVRAARNCQEGKIKPIDCRKHGEKFSLENVAPMYEDFFEKVSDIYTGRGWYEIHDPSLYTEEYLASQDKNPDGTPMVKKNRT